LSARLDAGSVRPMSPQFYYVVHVVSVILLFALTFSAFADPSPARRKKMLMATGILSILVFVAGWGLIEKVYARHIAGWMVVKMVVWLAVSAFTGIVFRRPSKARVLAWTTAVLAAVAVYMVYLKPF
jgi:hypothetical protein